MGERLVDDDTALIFNSAVSRDRHNGLSRPAPSGIAAAPRLTLGAGLAVTLVLSLGLWGAIWLALTYLAAALFG
jgi:hypothetical protein